MLSDFVGCSWFPLRQRFSTGVKFTPMGILGLQGVNCVQGKFSGAEKQLHVLAYLTCHLGRDYTCADPGTIPIGIVPGSHKIRYSFVYPSIFSIYI